MTDLAPLWLPLTAENPQNPGRDIVGGKALSLYRAHAAGFRVPRAIALTCAFFKPWITSVTTSEAWRAQDIGTGACGGTGEDPVGTAFPAMHGELATLRFTPEQRAALGFARSWLDDRDEARFAVRSSAPEEDSDTLSFAGALSSHLNVASGDLEEAIRDAFAALFAPQFLAYRRASGMAAAELRMAMVVQCMVNPTVAGVAFSLDPTSNDLDHTVISAAPGLGEHVVAGLTRPDTWILDSITGSLIQHQAADRVPCMPPHWLRHICDQIKRIEALWGCPVDVEWATESAASSSDPATTVPELVLDILQVRPITTHVPLAEELKTKPGERRRVYLDIALSSGLTMSAPITPLGLSSFAALSKAILELSVGPIGIDPDRRFDRLVHFTGSRVYLDLSNVLCLSSAKRLASKLAVTDVSMARIVSSLDTRATRSKPVPSWRHWSMLMRLPGVCWRLRGLYLNTLLCLLAPRLGHRRLSRRFADFEGRMRMQADHSLPLDEFWRRYVVAELPALLDQSMAVLAPGMLALQWQSALAKHVLEPSEVMALQQGFAGNPVVAMNAAMARLARAFQERGVGSVGEALSALERERHAALGQMWQSFLERFGHRGADEMDLGKPRYGDQPELALRSILAMPGGADADTAHCAQIAHREHAVQRAMKRSGWFRRRLLSHLESLVVRFAGWRDLPKHHLLMLLHRWRTRLQRTSHDLDASYGASCGPGHPESDAPIMPFLSVDELARMDAGRRDVAIETLAARRHDYLKLRQRVRYFPAAIDSRGRILRAPAPKLGEHGWQGIGVSAGVAKGRVRIARDTHLTLMPGEVLVAYVTDPGWTPLFLRAAAVILEVGGVLQHGAVVARELGLPCVIGIDGICAALSDHQLVEVDGASGQVHVLE